MKKNRSGMLMAALLWMTALACVLPSTQPASSAPPTPDTRLERMVAETVDAALALTQQVTPEPTLTPSATPFPTVTPIVIPETEAVDTTLEKTAEGGNLFNDVSGKYQLSVPAEWLTVRVNGQEFLDAGLLPEAQNPAIQRSLATIKNQDPAIFRLFMLDLNEEHIDGGFVTNINLVWDKQLEVIFNSVVDVEGLANSLKESLKDSEILSTELKTTQSGISMGVITTRTPIFTADGIKVNAYQKLVFFDLPVGTLSVTLSTTEKWQSISEPSFDTIIESFKILE